MIVIWRIARWWVLVGQNLHLCELWPPLKKVAKMPIGSITAMCGTAYTWNIRPAASSSCHLSYFPTLKQHLLWLKETKEQSDTVSKRAPGLPYSLCRAHRPFHLCSPLCIYPLISPLYVLLSEQSSNTGDQFKYWRFPLQCSSELEHRVKHKKLRRLPRPLSFF